jgi:hypothetical protein
MVNAPAMAREAISGLQRILMVRGFTVSFFFILLGEVSMR